MHGRYFATRKIEAYLATGKEKFKSSSKVETETQEKERMKKYEEWLESQH